MSGGLCDLGTYAPEVGVTTIVCIVKKDPVAGMGAGPGLKLSCLSSVRTDRLAVTEMTYPRKHFDVWSIWP